MDCKTQIISYCIDKLKGKHIKVTCQQFSICGYVTKITNRQYYFQMVIKCGRYKKSVILYYPFYFKTQDQQLVFDYSIKHLRNNFQIELVYNLIGECKCKPNYFLDKIVKVHEIRPNTEFP